MIETLTLLGSTGSIGKNALRAAKRLNLRIKALAAGKNVTEMENAAREFSPELVALYDERAADDLRVRLADTPIKVLGGADGVLAVASTNADCCLNAIVGAAGLLPTLAALDSVKRLALANKETLVMAGAHVLCMAREKGVEVIPVDSEHSAIFQCLRGEEKRFRRIILTASGGPFYGKTSAELANVTAADALKHPNWSMGAKVTIDSASMMNKGFEMIEARWLFDCPADRIEIVVHPQSIVHSMVQFADGSVKAQLGVPDMHLPIRYALGYPDRLATRQKPLELAQYATLTFEAPDMEKFPMLGFAFDAIAAGGNMPCVLNAANEVAVAAFLRGEIVFGDIPRLVEYTMKTTGFHASPAYEDLVATNAEARAKAEEALTASAR